MHIVIHIIYIYIYTHVYDTILRGIVYTDTNIYMLVNSVSNMTTLYNYKHIKSNIPYHFILSSYHTTYIS